MPQFALTRTALSALFVLGLLFLGCSTDDAPSYGEWTMMQEDLPLVEDLRVSETEDVYFGTITNVDATSEGRMVVADRRANNIKVLRPDGTLLDTLGGPGEGPGEFQQLATVQVARGDSIFAYDVGRSQLTVFGPASPYDVSRIITLPGDEGFVVRLFAFERQFVGAYGGGIGRPDEGVQESPPFTWQSFDEEGNPADTVLQTPSGTMAIASTEQGFRARTLPFGRTTQMTTGPDGRLYSGWTDSLHIRAHSLEGSSSIAASIATEPVPVTDADRDSVLSDVSSGMRSVIAPALPDTKPAFTELVLAADGRLWVRRPHEGPNADAAMWWVLDPDEQTIREARLPTDVEISVVQNGRVYGTTTTDVGAPAVVRYRINHGG